MKENQSRPTASASSSAPAAPTNASAPAAPASSSAPTVTTPVVPPVAPPLNAPPNLELKAKQDQEAAAKTKADALAAAQKIVAEANELLQKGLADASKTLGHSLRVMIANQFPETDGGRRIAEVAFENAKNVPAGKATRENLADALNGLTTAVNHIANHSLKFPGDLDVLRSAQRKLTGVAEQYDALIVPVVIPAAPVTAPGK